MYSAMIPALTVLALSSHPEPPGLLPLKALEDISTYSALVSVELGASALDRVLIDEVSGLIELPAGALTRAQADRLLRSGAVDFIVWSDDDDVFLGLRHGRVEGRAWGGTRLALGTPRTGHDEGFMRVRWLGALACKEEMPALPVGELEDAWRALCMGDQGVLSGDLDVWLKQVRDVHVRAWGELLKSSRRDEDALSAQELESFQELGSLYRRHAALHHAMVRAERGDFLGALDRLDEARVLGRRYDVKEGVLTASRIARLGHAFLLRAMLAHAKSKEDTALLDLYHTYPHWSAKQPAWLMRELARAMRREGHLDMARDLYDEVLPHATPSWALHAELASLHLAQGDAFRARALQLWTMARRKEPAPTHREAFTLLVKRADHGDVCVQDVDLARCAALSMSHQPGELILSPSERERSWGELMWHHERLARGSNLTP